MSALRAIHLLDDMSFGGVTRALSIFDHPDLARQMSGSVLAVDPRKRIAPSLEADVIVVHFTPRWNALPFMASLRLRNRHARIVHIEHSYTRSWTDQFVTRRRRFRGLLRLWFGICDEVIAVSHGQGAWLEDFVGKGPLRVIEPWSGLDNLELVPDVSGKMGGTLTLAAYGRFSTQKGFDTLIEAVRLLPADSVTLLLGGFGADEAMLRAAAQGMGNVQFCGRIDNVGAFLAQADVVVVPSRWEAFGQVAAEAKLAGRAVMVADVDGLPEQVVMPGWIADCTSPDTLADAIARIDRDTLAAVGTRNRAAMMGARQQRVLAWGNLIRDLKRDLRPVRSAARSEGLGGCQFQ